MTVSRRSFLKGSAVAGAAIAVTGGLVEDVLAAAPAMKPGPGNKWPGRVVINFNKNVVTNASTGAIDQAIAKKMIDDSIMLLAGQSTVGSAWKAIFPTSITASSKIAIKVPLGCAAQTVAPHWSTVKAITDGLLAMDFGGAKIPAANITIYDMRCSNNLTAYGYTATNFPGIGLVYDRMGSGYTDGAKNLQYATSLRADFLINVFRPGGHSSYVEGLTLGFKNHYGSYAVDHNASSAPGYLRDINCTGVVFDKNVLSICVGLFGAAEASNAPGSAAVSYYNYARTIDPSITNQSVAPTTIIMSSDPVSAEMQTIKMMRLNKNPAGAYGVSNMPAYLRSSAGITNATSGTAQNIGQIDESKMEIRRIINDNVMVEPSLSGPGGQSGATITALPIRGHGGTFIEFKLPRHLSGKDALLEIFDMKGALVRRHSQKVLGVRNQYSWDNTDASGRWVGLGAYIVRLASGNVALSTKVLTVR